MKFKILIFIALCLFKCLKAQDTLKVTTETGDFIPPQYLGEYDYLFREHEANKQLWKLDFPFISTKPFARMAFEQRLAKGVSVEMSAGVYEVDDEEIFKGRLRGEIGFGIEGRWYIFKNSNIHKNLTNNNLNGFYLGAGLEKFFSFYDLETNSSRLTSDYLMYSKLGFQKRFLNNKYLDFGLTLGKIHQKWVGYLNNNAVQDDLDIKWRAKLGWLINGSKEKNNCTVLRCFEEPKSLLKIDLLNVVKELDNFYQHFAPSIAYEHKLGHSAFSINTNALLDYQRIRYVSVQTIQPNVTKLEAYSKDKRTGFAVGIEPRWYFLMKRRISRGKQANNFNGFYAAYNVNYFNTKREVITTESEREKFPNILFNDDVVYKYNKWRHGVVLGHQQALSSNLFYEIRLEIYGTEGLDEIPPALNFKLGLAF